MRYVVGLSVGFVAGYVLSSIVFVVSWLVGGADISEQAREYVLTPVMIGLFAGLSVGLYGIFTKKKYFRKDILYFSLACGVVFFVLAVFISKGDTVSWMLIGTALSTITSGIAQLPFLASGQPSKNLSSGRF